MELDAQTADERENIDQILKGGRHLLELINEVLDISLIEAGHLSVSIEPVRLSEVIQDAVQVIRPLAAQSEIRIEGDFLESCTRHVLADRQRIKQVVLNLLSNAVKYNRPAGAITLACKLAPGEQMCLQITDTGYGLAPEEIGRAFRRVRASWCGAQRHRRNRPGTGYLQTARGTDGRGNWRREHRRPRQHFLDQIAPGGEPARATPVQPQTEPPGDH